jgi:hypothetical protein
MTPTRALAAFILLASTSPLAAQPDPVTAAREFREAHAAEILRDYAELLAIPNVARDTENIRRNAEAIRSLLAERGVAAELWTLPDAPGAPPIVYGRLAAAGSEGAAERTLGVYVHYDGQPVDPSKWTATQPWEPALYSAAVEAGASRSRSPRPASRSTPSGGSTPARRATTRRRSRRSSPPSTPSRERASRSPPIWSSSSRARKRPARPTSRTTCGRTERSSGSTPG